MKFWGAEVKPGEPLMVTPEDNKIHISQASLDCKGKMGETVVLSVNVDGTTLVIGTLSRDKFPQISLDLFFERNFELSHNCTKASVHFMGYKSPNIDQDEEGDDYSGSDEEVPAAPNIDQDEEGDDNSGSDEEEEVPAAPVAANPASTVVKADSKPKAKPEEVKPESDDDSDDKDDESHDDDDSEKGMDEDDSTDQRTNLDHAFIVEAATQKSKRESDDDDDSVMAILKKQKKEIDEINHSLKDKIDEMNHSLKEVYGFVKTLHENSLKKSEAKETPNKKVEPMYECCFGPKGIPKENNWDTVFVKGFDCSLSRDDIKSTLKNHFGSCGEVTRVFVPIECKTGSPLGFAFLDLKEDAEKALTLNGKVLGVLKLEVAMARERGENSFYPNFKGCKICSMASHRAKFRRFYEHHTGLKYSDSISEGRNGEKGIMMRRIVNDGYWPW